MRRRVLSFASPLFRAQPARGFAKAGDTTGSAASTGVDRPATKAHAQPRSSSPLSSSATASNTASSTLAASAPSPSSIRLDVVPQPYGIASGAPEEFVHRKVLIYRPSATVMQSGLRPKWKIQFDTTTKWLNPLMGWTSSKDTATQLFNMLQFETREQAIAFAEKEGFQWEELKEQTKVTRKKSYAENYKWKGKPKDEQQAGGSKL